jgi:hypothetical protein
LLVSLSVKKNTPFGALTAAEEALKTHLHKTSSLPLVKAKQSSRRGEFIFLKMIRAINKNLAAERDIKAPNIAPS